MSGSPGIVETEVGGEEEEPPFDPYHSGDNEWDDYSDPGCLPQEHGDEEEVD